MAPDLHFASVRRISLPRLLQLGVVLISLCGCTVPGAGPSPQPEFVVPGVLTIGTDPTYPPQEFVGPDGAITGFDIDLAREIASRLGRRLQVVPTPSRGLFPGLSSHKVDALVSAVTTGGDRGYGARFVAYLKVTAAFVTVANSAHHPQGPEQLCGLRVGVIQDSAEAETVRGLDAAGMACASRPALPVPTASLTEAADLLGAGGFDVLYTDGPPALALGRARRNVKVNLDTDPNRQAFEGIALSRDHKALSDQISKIFSALEDNGSYRVLLKRWGLEAEDIDSATRNATPGNGS